jgi:hypothetical protein
MKEDKMKYAIEISNHLVVAIHSFDDDVVIPAQGFIKPQWHEFEVALDGEQEVQHDGKLGEWVEAETQSEGV